MTILKNENAELNVALRSYLKTHPFNSVDKFSGYKYNPCRWFIKCV